MKDTNIREFINLSSLKEFEKFLEKTYQTSLTEDK